MYLRFSLSKIWTLLDMEDAKSFSNFKSSSLLDSIKKGMSNYLVHVAWRMFEEDKALPYANILSSIDTSRCTHNASGLIFGISPTTSSIALSETEIIYISASFRIS